MIPHVSTKILAKTIWISDVHIGSCGAQLEKFYTFLKNISCETLYLNGDIFDKWLINNIEQLKEQNKNILNQIKKLQQNGMKIIFLSGNHDKIEDIKVFLGDITYIDECIYRSVTNKSYLVFHGDKLDASVSLRMNWMSKLGTNIYEFLLSFKCNSSNNSTHFSRKVKIFIKNTIAKLSGYEKKLVKYLYEKNVDGVICGHSHQPKIKKINSKDYYNSGDWVDNCTFLSESKDGEISLKRWDG